MRENSIDFKRHAVMGIMLLSIYLAVAGTVLAQSTAFTYQGRLTDGGNPANGNYDIEFRLFDTFDVGTGTQISGTLTVFNVAVNAGLFTTQVDFNPCSSCFNGSNRFLQLAVRPNGGSTFTTLSPRQLIASAPHAIRSKTAGTAEALSCFNCVTTSNIASVNGSAVTGVIPLASVPSGSNLYIRNGAAEQAGGFNVSGAGIANAFSAETVSATAYLMNNERVLWNAGQSSNLFAGRLAGQVNLTGTNNSFFGSGAGSTNGLGNDNSFFGSTAGEANTTGSSNAFFGMSTGLRNTIGGNNSFFGRQAGRDNTEGDANAFFGASSGFVNTIGSGNSYFGFAAGPTATTGSNNTFIGLRSGDSNTTESANTYVGANASGSAGVTNATAIGFRARATQSNSLILGGITGFNGCTGPNGCSSVNVGIGTTAPSERLHIGVNSSNILFGSGGCNSGNAAIGFVASFNVCNNYSLLGDGTHTIINRDTGGTIFFREANTNQMIIAPGGNVGINTPVAQDTLHVNGIIRVQNLGAAASTPLCRNSSQQIASCSSSARYKSNIENLSLGLNVLRLLRPVAFDWKQDGTHDLGLIAEEVAKVEPRLITRNDYGEIEGVKYSGVGVVLINAVKEQQAQIAELREQLSQQRTLIADLKSQIKRPTRTKYHRAKR